ncbi:MAG: hypothetical protein ACSHWY_09140 [Octadecabacter sp.]
MSAVRDLLPFDARGSLSASGSAWVYKGDPNVAIGLARLVISLRVMKANGRCGVSQVFETDTQGPFVRREWHV